MVKTNASGHNKIGSTKNWGGTALECPPVATGLGEMCCGRNCLWLEMLRWQVAFVKRFCGGSAMSLNPSDNRIAHSQISPKADNVNLHLARKYTTLKLSHVCFCPRLKQTYFPKTPSPFHAFIASSHL